MHEQETTHSVRTMARVLKVSESGYYRWRDAGPGRRELRRSALTMAVREIHRESQERYGSPRVYRTLKRRGYRCSLTSVADIMREAGIRGKARRRWKATTNSKHREPVSPNLVPQGTCAIASNLIWVTDTTFIRTAEGWLYLCVFVDLYSRKVVGWATSSRNDKELVISAFWSALKSRRPGDGLIIHSDQGSTFASKRFRALLSASKCSQSMSRRGNCFDNAVCESFFHSLKVELDGDKQYVSRVAARERLFDYIEGFYNRVRLHSALAYRSPEEFELTARSA